VIFCQRRSLAGWIAALRRPFRRPRRLFFIRHGYPFAQFEGCSVRKFSLSQWEFSRKQHTISEFHRPQVWGANYVNRILNVRSAIYDQFHGSSSALTNLSQRADDFAAYYTSMYLIQDTGEAVQKHMSSDFSSDPWSAYLEFWGVMQAIIIQQDAISELHRVVIGVLPANKPNSAWFQLREKRNICAGHPVRRTHGVPATQRAFMGRSFGNYNKIIYELWDASTQEPTHPSFNLRRMLDGYDKEASQFLSSVLVSMKAQWP
jgi:hypothetical protein